MKPNEPSRTALIIARQRAAHQVLDHGSILYDPLAMKILGEDEKDALQFANEHPLASIGRLFTTARIRIAEDALSRPHPPRPPAPTFKRLYRTRAEHLAQLHAFVKTRLR